MSYSELDEFGMQRHGWGMSRQHDTTGMFSPVECSHCHGCYDLGTVTVTARYSDCSVWTTPCCNRSVDDRISWGTGEKVYRELR